MNCPLKAVLFDLDGTLVDSEKDIAEAVNFTREHYGLTKVPIPPSPNMWATAFWFFWKRVWKQATREKFRKPTKFSSSTTASIAPTLPNPSQEPSTFWTP